MSIKPLPGDVVAQIKSSVVITSLNNVICGLIKNSLDAEATKINLSVDHSRGNCSIEDNGTGILPSEFKEAGGGLGHLHCMSGPNCIRFLWFANLSQDTSKHPGRPGIYGKHGTFLASVASLSLLSITSHHREYHSHNSMSMHNSRVLTRYTPALPEQRVLTFSHGTRVTVRDLFGSMPVRVKHRAHQAERSTFSRECDQLVLDLVALLLAWQSAASVSIRDASSRQILTLRRTSQDSISDGCRLLHQASLCESPDASDWTAVGASAPNLSISGYVCKIPVATKRIQFVSLGIEPLSNEFHSNVLYEEINRVFADSSFGVIEDDADYEGTVGKAKMDSFTNKELKTRKGVDRWPMFFIRISPNSTTNRKTLQLGDILDERQQSLAMIIDLLKAMFYQFLKKKHCRPKAVNLSMKPRSHDTNPKVSATEPALSSSTSKKRSRTGSPSTTPANYGIDTARQSPSIEHFGSRDESPFAAWSRIKSGQTLQTYNKEATDPPSRASSTSASNTFERPRTASTASSKPSLYDANGKLTRKPFEELDVGKLRGRTLTREPDSRPAPPRPVQEDAYMWTNPATKLTSVVDSRTGYVVPPKPVTLSRRLSMPNRGSEKAVSDAAAETRETTPWMKDLMSRWKNPVFELTEAPIPRIPDVSDALGIDPKPAGHRCNDHFSFDFGTRHETSSIGLQGRLSKATLRRAHLIAQVDRKFVLAKVPFSPVQTDDDRLEGAHASSEESSFLVLIDQHAADERCRVEELMRDYFKPGTNRSGDRVWRACADSLEKPVQFELSSQEQDLFGRFRPHFEHWGICYELIPAGGNNASRFRRPSVKVSVQSLPPSIIERCRTDTRLLAELLRKEAWKLNDESVSATLRSELQVSQAEEDGQAWVSRFHGCPQGILELINSRSCRSKSTPCHVREAIADSQTGAIMFNDVLTMDQCASLLDRLVQCAFPFQCAHGRPSMVPIVDLGDEVVDLGRSTETSSTEGSFLQKFKKWEKTL